MYYLESEHTFVKFAVSTKKGKKYDAFIKDKQGNLIKIPFGALGYQQFKDKALGVYSADDHNDEKRLQNYRARHLGYLKPGYFSPEFFAWNYLWSK